MRLFSATHDNLNISSLVPISNISVSSEKVLRYVSINIDIDRNNADDFARDNTNNFARNDTDDFARDDADDFTRDDANNFARDDADEFTRDDADNFARNNANDFARDDADDVIMLYSCMRIVICIFAMISPPFILLPSLCLIVIL